jgi:hypothetical protein
MRDTRLTTTDAFFVAYQEKSGILMHFGVEVELAAPPSRTSVDRAIASTLTRWPFLAQTLAARALAGLRWTGAARPVLHTGTHDDVMQFRNTAIDPFREPPFGVLWSGNTLAFRCHHAAADGELFIEIVRHFLAALAEKIEIAAAPGSRAHPLSLRSLRKQARVRPSMRYAKWLATEAKAGRSLRLHLARSAPGPIAMCERTIDRGERDNLFERARDERVSPAWLIAAAWMQALHAWSLRTNDSTTPLVSLEVPVSLRRRGEDLAGNALAVTTLFGDARRPVEDLARGLLKDYAGHIKRHDHLAVPLLSAPARLLPWPIFKRVAVTTTSTGFATSHFTWVDHAPEGLSIERRHLYTPVCQHMGAALCVLASRDGLQLSITHRTNGVSAADASTLADLLLERLAARDMGSRQQVQQV